MDEQLFQDYRLLQRLSHSAGGDFYRVVAQTSGQELLLQPLPLALPAEKLAQDVRWLARPVASLGRPAVSRIVASGQGDDGNLYLVYEDAEGEPLQTLISGAAGNLDPAVALTVVGQIAQVLERGLKAGVIHKLLLPHYLLVRPDEPPTILGLDLPASLADRLLPLLPEEELVYLSPEQRRGNVIDGRSNIYSLGALLYSLLTGDPPLPDGPDGKRVPLAERRPDLSQPTIRLVETCLQPDSWMRFQTYEALRNAIDQAAGIESPAEATTETSESAAPAAARRRPFLLHTSLAPLLTLPILIAAGAALTIGGAFWLLFGSSGMDEMTELGLPTATATRLAPLDGDRPAAVATTAPGPTPTLLATSTPAAEMEGVAAVEVQETPTRAVQPASTATLAAGDEDAAGPTATSPPRFSTPRPTLTPTPFFFPTATPTSPPPLPTLEPTAAGPPPPAPPTTEPPPTTIDPEPTATSPPPPTATPPSTG